MKWKKLKSKMRKILFDSEDQLPVLKSGKIQFVPWVKSTEYIEVKWSDIKREWGEANSEIL